MPKTPRVSQPCCAWFSELIWVLKEGGSAYRFSGGGCERSAQKWSSSCKHLLSPNAPLTAIEPVQAPAPLGELRLGEEFIQQFVNATLKHNVFGTESVRLDMLRKRRHAGEKIVGLHPPGKPGFELWLTAELVDEVAIIIEDGAIANDVRAASRSIQLRGNLSVKNPQLAFQRCGGIYGEWGAASYFRDQLDIFSRFFQEGANLIGQRRFPDAMRADQSEFQMSEPFELRFVSSIVSGLRKMMRDATMPPSLLGNSVRRGSDCAAARRRLQSGGRKQVDAATQEH